MVTYVLDASAILRYLDREAGFDRVSQIINGHLAGLDRVVMSAVHCGEVAGVICRNHGRATVDLALARLFAFGFEIVPATAERAIRAALIKVERNIPYADAFGVELASGSPEHVLVTADFDLKAATRDVKIEFLPKK